MSRRDRWGQEAVTLRRDVAERALALAERVLAAQGDAAEADIIDLQHELSAVVTRAKEFFGPNITS
ncbi:hypothetical protein OpiT1DRAFT_00179 [Opitutaceae bacterium TAV1]|nr:hypothetical protein OpiT1DRAFT_00179 [Opitutaceae bacterium TAV1]